jgi:hypothetical protein
MRVNMAAANCSPAVASRRAKYDGDFHTIEFYCTDEGTVWLTLKRMKISFMKSARITDRNSAKQFSAFHKSDPNLT